MGSLQPSRRVASPRSLPPSQAGRLSSSGAAARLLAISWCAMGDSIAAAGGAAVGIVSRRVNWILWKRVKLCDDAGATNEHTKWDTRGKLLNCRNRARAVLDHSVRALVRSSLCISGKKGVAMDCFGMCARLCGKLQGNKWKVNVAVSSYC